VHQAHHALTIAVLSSTVSAPTDTGGAMRYRSVFRDELFAGQHVVVTGGGSGIGRCTAHELAALGARLALVGRRPEKLAAVAAEIIETGGTPPTTHACDIRIEDAGAANGRSHRGRAWAR
jgi:D-arabinose 1-dehydrogenase-like Zn-dependent alcohol dehydrogenase